MNEQYTNNEIALAQANEESVQKDLLIEALQRRCITLNVELRRAIGAKEELEKRVSELETPEVESDAQNGSSEPSP